MKKSSRLLNILTKIIASIGVCAAALSCFIIFHSIFFEEFIPPNGQPSSRNVATIQNDAQPGEPSAQPLQQEDNPSLEAFTAPDITEADNEPEAQSFESYQTENSGVSSDMTPDTSIETKPANEDPLGFNVIFSNTYRNDVTGNWRLAKTADNINIEEHAVNYYNNYFKSDNEVHIIINFALNTTSCITVMGNLLDVSVMEYVDKEEHDAKLACSGMLLSEYHVNIDTGEIEQIQPQKTATVNASAIAGTEVSTPVGNTVWLSATGSKYHRINNCGQMDPYTARQVSLENAINMGYEKCDNCY